MSRVICLSELYEKSVKELTKNRNNWKGLLSGMARYYKYSFDNNVLIYAQRPDAGLLATMEVWNDERVGRRVNKGAKSIAVLNLSNPKTSLRYLFDMMDTNGDNESLKRVLALMWNLEEQYKPALLTRLDEKYGTGTASMENGIYALVQKRANEMLPLYIQDFTIMDPNHILYDLPIDAVTDQFAELVRDSAGYVVFKKCGLPTDFYEEDCFDNISHFNSIGLFTRIGCAALSIARPILQEVNMEIQAINRKLRNDFQLNCG